MFARETSALAAMRTIHTVQAVLLNTAVTQRRSRNWSARPAGRIAQLPLWLIDGTLASGEKGGWYTLTANQGGYIINANPVSFGTSGSRTFYSDQSMVINRTTGPNRPLPTAPK